MASTGTLLERRALQGEVGSSCCYPGFAEPLLDMGTGVRKQNEAARPMAGGEQVGDHKELLGG